MLRDELLYFYALKRAKTRTASSKNAYASMARAISPHEDETLFFVGVMASDKLMKAGLLDSFKEVIPSPKSFYFCSHLHRQFFIL